MSSFSDDITKTLKQTLLLRAPECKFTVQDVATVVASTGLSVEQVMKWASHFRARTPWAMRTAHLGQDKAEAKVMSVCFQTTHQHFSCEKAKGNVSFLFFSGFQGLHSLFCVGVQFD